MAVQSTLGKSYVGAASGSAKPSSSYIDYTDPTQVAKLLGTWGYEEPKPKANLLDRISMIFGSDEWSDDLLAYMNKERTFGQSIADYFIDIPKNIALGFKPGLTKEEVYKESGKGKELAEKLGVKGKAAGWVGLGADIATPSLLLSFVPGAGQVSWAGKGKTIAKVLGKQGAQAATDVLAKESPEIAAKIATKLGKEGLSELDKSEVFLKFLTKESTKSALKKSGVELFKDPGWYFAGKRFAKGLGAAQKPLELYTNPLGTVAQTSIGKEITGFAGQTLGNIAAPLKKLFSTSTEIPGAPALAEAKKTLARELNAAVTRGELERGKYSKYIQAIADATSEEDVARVTHELMERTGTQVETKKMMETATGKKLIGRKAMSELPSVKEADDYIKRLEESDAWKADKMNMRSIQNWANSKKGISLENAAEQMGPGAVKALDEHYNLVSQMDELKMIKGEIQTGLVEKKKESLGLKAQELIRSIDDVDLSKVARLTPEGGADITLKPAKELIGTLVDMNATSKPEREALGLGDVGTAHLTRNVEGYQKKPGQLVRRGGKLVPKEEERLWMRYSEAEKGGVTYEKGVKNLEDAVVADTVKANQVHVLYDWFDNIRKSPEEFGVRVGEKLTEDELLSGVLTEIKDIPMLKGMYAPPDIVDILTKTKKIIDRPEEINSVLKGIDKVEGLFKQYVTSFAIPIPIGKEKGGGIKWLKIPVSPWFFGRNIWNNTATMMIYGDLKPWDITQRYLDAISVNKYMSKLTKEGYDDAAKALGEKQIGRYTVKDIFDKALSQNLIGSGWYKMETDSAAGKVQRLFSASDFGSGSEDAAKVALFIDGLNKGKSVQESADTVRRLLFDYGDLTDFEKNTMRRIFPFYTWAKKNLELQINVARRDPRRMAIISKGYQYLEKLFNDLTDEERANLDPWMRDSLALTFGRKGDKIKVITNMGTSYEAMTGIFGTDMQDTLLNLLAMSRPELKIPLELMFGQSAFRKIPIYQDVYATEYKNLPGFAKSLLGVSEIPYTNKTTGEEDISYRMPSERKYIATNIGSPELGLLRKLTGAKDVGYGASMLGLLGFKSYERDISEMSRAEQERRLVEMQRKLMLKKGFGREFSNIYLPKEQQEYIKGK